jgi:hypothetical protein
LKSDEKGDTLPYIKNSWKCLFGLLIVVILNSCGSQNNGSSVISIVPEGAIWTNQVIREDTPPNGYGAMVIWAQTATLKGGQPKSVTAFVTIDYWKAIEEINGKKNVLYEEHYDYNYRKEYTLDDAGLFARYPKWFDPTNNYQAQAYNMYAQNGLLLIDVSQTPDNIVHWWTPRQVVKAGAKYSVEMRLKVEGKCSVQLGSDYWRDLIVGVKPGDADCKTANNCEAWISDWIGDTSGQFVTVTAPLR